jgi:tetratricopeptide (TPR) repeat protein
MGGVCGRLGLRELAAPEDWDVGLIYYHMGGAFHSQSKLGLAADLLEKALSYREATLGKTHDDTLSTALSLAWVFTNKCEFDRALVLFEEVAAAQKVGAALSMVAPCGNECARQEEYGEGSSEYAKTLSSMGVVYLRKGDLDRAAELFEEYADIIKVHHSQCAAHSQLQLVHAGSPRRAEPKLWN